MDLDYTRQSLSELILPVDPKDKCLVPECRPYTTYMSRLSHCHRAAATPANIWNIAVLHMAATLVCGDMPLLSLNETQAGSAGPVLSQGRLTILGRMLIDSETAMIPPLRTCQGLLKNIRDRALGKCLKKKNPICNMASSTVPGWLMGLLEIARLDFVKDKM